MTNAQRKSVGAPAKRGRPNQYQPNFARQAQKLCLLGAIDEQLADFFGVSRRTVERWKKAYPEFAEALKAGKMLADAEVAEALFRRATGYSYTAVKIMHYQGEIIRAEYTEHLPPDTTAASFWLKNRRPDLWREKPADKPDDGKSYIVIRGGLSDEPKLVDSHPELE